ncbi:metalloendoproteinase 1-MMP-like [Rhododendron vialii]|uniref:metalloendoproteinase 1-MMP-like n=1 Tax=Rhododendron vialii TaxID=182163 RepID=UPI00265E85C4|nr:metalloendoproteinase 1-MMP-like [Rhododendron vialii]
MLPFFSYNNQFSLSLLLLLFFSLFFSLPPSVPARSLSDPFTENDPWRGFARFVDAGRGSHVSGMSELKKYFQRFGYLEPVPASNLTDSFDAGLESAVEAYQKKLGLAVTGRLDPDTVSQIMSPRCGVSDVSRTMHVTRHYMYFYGKPRWNPVGSAPITLTYAFAPGHSIGNLPKSDVASAFERAFSRWSSVIPVTFKPAQDYSTADVRIGFYRGDHGDGDPFDGVLGILGHAFSPRNGRLHLDGAETWAVDFGSEKSRTAVDLESVATHEIGHVLGLAHSPVKEAVMYPSLSPRTRKVDLKVDDVEGVQALYGSNPDFKFSSLLESDTSSSSCWAVGFGRSWHGRAIYWIVVVLGLVMWI